MSNRESDLSKLSLLCPTRGRPDDFSRFVRSVAETAGEPGRVEILAYVDEDDDEKFEYILALKTLLSEVPVSRLAGLDLVVDEPLNTPLINNILAEQSNGDVLLIANDDQIYRDKNWDIRIDEEVKKFPDQIYCMWFNDGRYGEKICTFPIVSRRWIETLGYVEPPMFEHFNCDLWTWQIGHMIGRLNYIGDIFVEHAHPDTGKSESDETTERNLRGNRPQRDQAWFTRFERYRILDAGLLQDVIEAEA